MSRPQPERQGDLGREAGCAESLRFAAAAARDDFTDALARQGFRLINDVEGLDEAWCGLLAHGARVDESSSILTTATMAVTAVGITIPPGFPFAPPRVYPWSRSSAEAFLGFAPSHDYYEAGNGWHRDLDLAMCLFDQSEFTKLHWADGVALLDKARAWLRADVAGWVDDVPALDLQRYLYPAEKERLLLYGQLDQFDGTVLRASVQRNGILRLGPVASKRSSGSKRHVHQWGEDAYLVLDAGELVGPVRDWDDLCTAVGSDRGEKLVRAHRSGLIHVLMTYTRQNVPAVIGIELLADQNGPTLLRALRTAPDDETTRRIRAGVNSTTLADRSVAVVGVGAVGSIVADLLHRAGVGSLHLIDADYLLPGNTTRHLLGEKEIGRLKAQATAGVLTTQRAFSGRVTFHIGFIETIELAVEVLKHHDVVVDATADPTATALLTAAARSGAGELLSVSVLADGYAVRVDRTPTPKGHSPLPPSTLPSSRNLAYEAGCGSPVSTTPPSAVWEAAAIATRHATALLAGPDSLSAGEERRIQMSAGTQ